MPRQAASVVPPHGAAASITLAEYVSAKFSAPVQVIQIRPHRNGWQCFEAPGVQPYWTGEQAKEMAINYAKGRATSYWATTCVLPDATPPRLVGLAYTAPETPFGLTPSPARIAWTGLTIVTSHD